MSSVEQVKQKLDLVDVVSETVRLRKSGKSFSGFCPFHPNSRTPAFYVFPDTQSWHCFGACGTGGDLFAYVMKRDHLDFGEALRQLAQRAGVRLERADAGEDAQRQRLREILAATAAQFHYQLKHHPAAQGARDYVAKRFISAETAAQFELGYALDDWNATRNFLRGKGFAEADIEAAGLIGKSEQGNYYDRFRGRLMFPIRNRNGEVIGFGARTLTGEEPKYLNSPQTALFDKSGTLYGMDQAQDAIRAQDLAVIVEGYMDVIGAHQAGFKNVVASLGTALTEKQLGLLKRLTKRYALALDPDAAGEEATKRGLEVAREALTRKTVPVPMGAGMIGFEQRLEAELLVIPLPPGQDPDELIHDNPAQWTKLVAQAEPLVDFYFRVLTQDVDLTSARGKSLAVQRLAPILREIGDAVQRGHYTQKLARLVKTTEAVIARETTRRAETRRAKDFPAANALEASPAEFNLSESFLTFALLIPEHLPRLAFLDADAIADTEQRVLYAALRAFANRVELLERDAFRASLDAALAPLYDVLIERGAQFAHLGEPERRREVEKAARRLLLSHDKSELEIVQAELSRWRDERVAQTEGSLKTEPEIILEQRANQLTTRIAESQRALKALTLYKTHANVSQSV